MTNAIARSTGAQETRFSPLGDDRAFPIGIVSALATSRIVSVSIIIVLVLLLILGIPGSFAT